MASGTHPDPGAREVAAQLARYWWLWLVASVFWLVISLVILQFDDASIRTVGKLS